jgi:hypothetical protein
MSLMVEVATERPIDTSDGRHGADQRRPERSGQRT